MSDQTEQPTEGGAQGTAGGERLARFATRLTALLREDAELRRAALGIANWLQATCSESGASERAGEREAPTPASSEPVGVSETLEELERHEVTLSIGGQHVRVDAIGREPDEWVGAVSESSTEAQPIAPPIAAEPSVAEEPTYGLLHCARLAERASMDLERLAAESLTLRKQDVAQELASAWSREDWTFWALDPGVRWPAPEELRDLVAVYSNLAEALRLAAEIRGDEQFGEPYRERAYTALAETQSALRVALDDWAFIERDRLQCEVFRWLSERTRIDRVFVSRYMRLDDAGDPQAWKGTREGLEQLAHDWHAGGGRQREQQKLRSKLEYHLGRIEREAGHRPLGAEWRSVDAAVCRLLELGVPASNVGLREALLYMLELIPDEFDPSAVFGRVLDELHGFLEDREERELAARQATTRERTAAVQQVAALLRGRELVLIGGVERPESKAALVREFELADLHWISTDAHRSYTTFEPAVARPETAVVILAIRWSSHSYENVKRLCEKHNKPYVRLPGGYNPNQVASQILAQVSVQLGCQ